MIDRVECGAPLGVELRLQGAFGDLMGSQYAVLTGIPSLDRVLVIRGDAADALSLLGASARGQLLHAFMAGAKLSRGAIVDERRTPPSRRSEQENTKLASAMWTAAGSIRALADTTAARLGHNVCHDPEPGFRRRSLELLVDRFSDAEATGEVVGDALADDAPTVRVYAARVLTGDRGRDVLRALIIDDDLDDGTLADALFGLADRGEAPPIARLRALTEGDQRLRAAVARSAGVLGDAPAEDLLLELLDARDDVVDVVAAEALADCGTERALAPLIAHTKGFFRDRLVKRAARAALEQLRERLGREGGRLSLADRNEAGGLSVTDDER